VRLLIAALTVWFLAGTAHGDSSTAKRAFEKGMTAYNLQDFSTALEMFKRAYEELHDPAFLFNIGQAQRQLGQYEAAARSYRIYLASQPGAPNREQVKRLIQQMDEAAKEARAQKPPALVQPPMQATQPPPASVPPPAMPPPVDSGRPMRLAGIITAGVGVGLLALGVVFAVLSKQAGDDAYHPSSGIYDHAADERQANLRNAEIATFVVGGAAAVAGTTVWLLGRRSRSTSHAALTPVVSGAGVGVRF
jgi:tetratricopeptide (TPR) repeat protein